MKLAVISHTPHYMRDGTVTGWGPTVRELNHLADIFSKIYHLAPMHSEKAPDSSLPYKSDKITHVPLKHYGGPALKDKFSVITTAPHNLKIIGSFLDKVDWAQFRAPTGMGVYVLPYLAARKSPKRWVKYAGNWKMEDPPLSYSFQKWLLEKNFLNCKVTINGWWEGQKEHIVSFPNPCLDDEELLHANRISGVKNFDGKLNICFSGTLTENKGCRLLMEALLALPENAGIGKVVFAGGGPLLNELRGMAEHTGIATEFPGFVERGALGKIYEDSHLLVLPSQSEGFPKVVAEAAAYGCVSIVTDVSSISQFFGDDSAFLLKERSSAGVLDLILKACDDRAELKSKSKKCAENAGIFTFSYFTRLLREKILDLQEQ